MTAQFLTVRGSVSSPPAGAGGAAAAAGGGGAAAAAAAGGGGGAGAGGGWAQQSAWQTVGTADVQLYRVYTRLLQLCTHTHTHGRALPMTTAVLSVHARYVLIVQEC